MRSTQQIHAPKAAKVAGNSRKNRETRKEAIKWLIANKELDSDYEDQ